MLSKFISALSVSCTILFADVVSSDLINIHAKIYPQIPLFTATTQPATSIIIAALYQNISSKRKADEFVRSVEAQYGTTLKNKKLIIKPMLCEDALKTKSSFNGIYIIECDSSTLKEFAGVITFAAKQSDFDANYAMFYVDVTSRTRILINKKVLLNSGITFMPEFLKITTVVQND